MHARTKYIDVARFSAFSLYFLATSPSGFFPYRRRKRVGYSKFLQFMEKEHLQLYEKLTSRYTVACKRVHLQSVPTLLQPNTEIHETRTYQKKAFATMGRRQKVRSNAGNRKLKRGQRDLKRRGKDIDQVHADLKKGHVNLPVDEDLPGKGQFYCISCARYFINDSALQIHMQTKAHKRRLVVAQETPWTHEDAEEAAK
ncbi:bud site selection protein, putative [Toxoplasma gondii ME49]|uniref:Bud site selection protein, putative n=4 Tax=Toxoplasma gondii TaxID=5811 RepID=S8F0W2_TOXGM|nr:bud site selection protein, putative [Toxoplasma gondii ME49]EPT27118.1 bud site selection protein, putative [Toxoplasma gondii ME49]KFG45373.1 putative bud site selection protein [Toxoplasma gondii GAB2-2007-GAL-DOM2]KFH09661.1 putative bud site selection protein [Toxoplasma gondii MAS]KYF43268.1 putative bud site selection protein [Toxoplasma gondii ARI]|eukprot:XP_018636023.1 bud site selection protein, putative [Toxoplasma gondii ME49]